MLSNGLTAGEITGLSFNVENAGTELKNLKIRMKHVVADDLDQSTFEQSGMATVYEQNTTFTSSSWNSLNFTTSFDWDGFSNILLEISYSNSAAGFDNTIKSSSTSFISGIQYRGNDKHLSFNGPDFVKFEDAADIFNTVDDEITISFWLNGNAAIQPQNDHVFEAADAQNRRVVSVHLPWSNSRVYWDAGNAGTGSYDRIDKAADATSYEGQWNHWAFTKNNNTG